MSDLLSRTDHDTAADPHPEPHDGPVPPSAVVEVRRRALLCALVGLAAAVVCVLYLVRALSGDGGWLAWGVAALTGGLAVLHLLAVLDGRTPLLVADTHGVRLRTGRRWHGLAWDALDCVEHLPRRRFRDGHVLVVDREGEQTPVALSLSTRLVGTDEPLLADTLAALADGRCDVVEVDAGAGTPATTDPVPDTVSGPAAADDEEVEPVATWADDADTGEIEVVEAVVVTPADPVDVDDDADRDDEPDHPVDDARPWAEPATALQPSTPPSPVRAPVVAARSETLASRIFSSVIGANALRRDPAADRETTDPLPELEQLRRPAVPEDDAWLAGAGTVEHTPADDETAFVEPVADPVVGPVLAAARERLGLDVDQLAARTRIRPHVIEAIEVDDFAPCGGDFYARGHLRTLARVLGTDAAPLLAAYDETYADAPVDPRRVFEADLASGAGGALRSTRGGPNWTVLVAAVMGVVLVWSVARLLMDGPAPTPDTPVLSQSGGLHDNKATGKEVPLTLTAAGGGATVRVTDANGEVVFEGDLAFGQTADVNAVPPVKVSASDGSVTASVDGAPAEALGATGEDVDKTLVAP